MTDPIDFLSWRPRAGHERGPHPEIDTTDPSWYDALAYFRPRGYLDHVNADILAAFLAGARSERARKAGAAETTETAAGAVDWKARAIETYREIEADTWASADLREQCRQHRELLEAEAAIRWSGES